MILPQLSEWHTLLQQKVRTNQNIIPKRDKIEEWCFYYLSDLKNYLPTDKTCLNI